MAERAHRDSLLRSGEEYYWQCPNERCRAAFALQRVSALAAERACPQCGQDLDVAIRRTTTEAKGDHG
jgi:hypothetical protein